jgi:hypothetical protein
LLSDLENCFQTWKIAFRLGKLPSGHAQLGKGSRVMFRRIRRKAAENDASHAAGRGCQFRRDSPDRDPCRAVRRIAKDPGRNRRERYRRQAVRGGESESIAVAPREQVLFTVAAAVPHRTDGMDDMFCRQLVAAGDPGVAGVAAAKCPAFIAQLRPGGTVDRAVDTAAAEQTPVRRIDDDVDIESRDVGDEDLKSGSAYCGDEKR